MPPKSRDWDHCQALRTITGVRSLSLRLSPTAYRRITVAALVALCVIVVTGASVRLTDSGLGCPDWPQCEDESFFASPDDFHGMVENLNRLFTGVVAASVILAVLGSLVRTPRRRDLTWLSLGLVAGVLAQIVWGAFTVWSGLRPEVVMVHYLISAVLIVNATVLVQRAATGGPPRHPAVPPGVLSLSRAMVGTAIVVVVAGTVVTNTGPHAGDREAVRFGFDIAQVARFHGIAVLVLLAVTIATLATAHAAGAPRAVRRRGGLLVAVLLAQAGVGYWQYLTGVPELLVGIHVFGSVLVIIAVTSVHLAMVRRPGLHEELVEGDPPHPSPSLLDAGVG